MRNHIQPGNTLTFPAPAAVISGGVVIAGSIIGVANGDAAEAELVDVDVVGVFELPKVAADDIALGDKVYWTAGTGLATKTAAGSKLLGVATEAAGVDTATVKVRLNGSF